MNELAQFLGYVAKVFHLGQAVRGVRSDGLGDGGRVVVP
jgi:hypothetical protein